MVSQSASEPVSTAAPSPINCATTTRLIATQTSRNCAAAAAVAYFLPRHSARRRNETDAAAPDLSKLGRLPLELIERSLAYLPLRFLSNSVKNVNARYRELALPLLVRRVLWLERELSHDEFEAVAGDVFARRRPYFVELEQLCKTLKCATYIQPPPAELLES